MTKTEKIPIWLDCDPGNDDAFAILLTIFNPRFNLLGISTVHGNAPLSMTTRNTLGILDILKVSNIKVYEGSTVPLHKPPHYALHVHGTNGIGGVIIPEETKNSISQDMDYLEAMRLNILKYEGKICLICTGTLTNIAKLIEKYPELKSKLRYISIMGGAFEFGNITPYAEFNFHTDPDAASYVLDQLGSKVILTPLNLTHKAVATEEIRNRIYNESTHDMKNSEIRKSFFAILMFYANIYYTLFGMKSGPPVHDPLAVFSLLPFIDEDFGSYGYKYIRRKIKIVTEGIRQGESVIINKELDEDVEEENGIYIGQEVDTQLFWNTVISALNSAEYHIKKITSTGKEGGSASLIENTNVIMI
ncbi:URH1 [[Candida] subhashii]|uniref:URH1 n=1 Tax=[Candida] subhashii TaxID=561895 RepID=A0A8J5Q8G2_9ASCO|nr:URH1 [[Candida] subhashii]KAG7661446.1 URH1 [[Candida] subhashii]